MIGLYSEDICYDIFVINNFFDFYWNVFNKRVIKFMSLSPYTYNET